jgi:hypothetical protein
MFNLLINPILSLFAAIFAYAVFTEFLASIGVIKRGK